MQGSGNPGLLVFLGRGQRMNGLGHRVGAVLGALAQAVLGCAKPVWQRPEPFEAFCGCWLLLPHSLFQPFYSQPRQEIPGFPPTPPRQVWKTEELFRGYSGDSPGGVGLYWYVRKQTRQENRTSSIQSSL